MSQPRQSLVRFSQTHILQVASPNPTNVKWTKQRADVTEFVFNPPSKREIVQACVFYSLFLICDNDRTRLCTVFRYIATPTHSRTTRLKMHSRNTAASLSAIHEMLSTDSEIPEQAHHSLVTTVCSPQL